MKLVPLGDRVVLKQSAKEETTKSGIILAAKAQERPENAEVIAVGPGGMVDGKEVTMQVKVGDQVIYSKYKEDETMKYVCDVCGWEYDEEKGYPEGGIAPGTKWEDVPEDFECPLCFVGKDQFSKE